MFWLARVGFLIAFGVASYFMYLSIKRIRRNILLGKDVKIEGDSATRWKNMFLIAFGQKKMFKKPLPAILHVFVYIGFLIVNMEMLEIVVDGIFGTHRIFQGVLGALYNPLINSFETLAVLVILACIAFLVRRNVMKVNRFENAEIDKKERLDANTILVTEILLMFAFLSMNATDSILQARGVEHYVNTGDLFFSSYFQAAYMSLSDGALQLTERFFWWFHILGVLLFANYVFMDSKHLHIFLAFPNTYYTSEKPAGTLSNMDVVTKEVKLMLNLPLTEEEQKLEASGKFGARDVTDLSWKNILDAYTCTECGRCTQQCPANITGKKLSPRKIMMDTRDRAEALGRLKDKQGSDATDEKALLGDYISEEEILACTTCNACVEACPVNINPVDIIIQLRRYNVMELSKAPQAWNMMFSNVENNAAPWKFSSADRFNWSQKLNG